MSTVLLKNGLLLDKSSDLHQVKKDLLIENNVIKKIADTIDEPCDKVIDCEGKIVSPGFTDVHVHVFNGCPGLGITPDPIGIEMGVTSLMDAGTAGPANFEQFVEEVVKPSKTRVFSAMNYSKMGLWDKPEGNSEDKWDLDLAEKVYHEHEDIIVAIKARASNSCVGKLGIVPIKAAKELASRCNIPLYVHIGHALPLIEDTLNVMQKGDIITHAYHGKDNNVLDDNGQLKKETKAALDRGVKFDVGHGRESFCFTTLEKAMKIDFLPDCVSTDLHLKSYNHPVKSLAETMDKMVMLGISLEDVVADVTCNPARLLNLKKLGSLKEGNLADITIFHVEEKETLFTDSEGNQMTGHSSIIPDYAIVDGNVYTCTYKKHLENMELIDHLIPKLVSTNKEDVELGKKYLLEVLDFLAKENVFFDENSIIGLGSHLFGLVSRIKSKEEMEDLGELMINEIEPRVLDLAKHAASIIEVNENVTLVKSEILLIAIHIQNVINNG